MMNRLKDGNHETVDRNIIRKEEERKEEERKGEKRKEEEREEVLKK